MTLPLAALLAVGAFVPLGECTRPAEPDSTSSLTVVSNGVYWTSTDWNPVLYEVRVPAPPAACTFRRLCALTGATDIEGIARDPLTGRLWVADEGRGEVLAYDPTTGKRLSTLTLPPVLRKTRTNYGFESLALAPTGLELFLANEESLPCDGPVSSAKQGSLVRLVRFTRTSASTAWVPAGQWAYRVDPLGGSAPLDACRSGLADLCVWRDGTLLALEREYSFKPFPSCRCRIYAVNRTAATDISACTSLADPKQSFKPVAKRLLYEANTGLVNYEGFAPRARTADGKSTLVLISDGGQMMPRKLLVLREE